jgi:hypothetical protein
LSLPEATPDLQQGVSGPGDKDKIGMGFFQTFTPLS